MLARKTSLGRPLRGLQQYFAGSLYQQKIPPTHHSTTTTTTATTTVPLPYDSTEQQPLGCLPKATSDEIVVHNVGTDKMFNTSRLDDKKDYISQVRWKHGSDSTSDMVTSSTVNNINNVNSSKPIPSPVLPDLVYKCINNKNLSSNLVGINGPGMLGISGNVALRNLYSRGNGAQRFSYNNVLPSGGREEMSLHGSNNAELYLDPISQSILRDYCSGRSYLNTVIGKRYLHTSLIRFDDKPSSQVEVTVNALKEKVNATKNVKDEAAISAETKVDSEPLKVVVAESSSTTTSVDATTTSSSQEVVSTTDIAAVAAARNPEATAAAISAAAAATTTTTTTSTEVVKKTLWVRFIEEVKHYYHGFRLLFIDTSICIKYCLRVAKGERLNRREYRQLIRTTGDLFRLLPFSVFIIVPFMEVLLPFAIKMFPGMLPSTFETANEKEAKLKKTLKVKLEMARFLQETLDNMSLEAKDHKSKSAKEFVLFFEKVRRTGEHVTNEEILKFSTLFEDSITLDSLSRPQLTALCRLLDMKPFGANTFLRFQLRMKLRSLAADDKLIAVEGVDSLSPWELQHACRSRGMRAFGMTDVRLAQQLKQWLELSLDLKVPPSLLLLSRTLYLPEDINTNVSLAATISQLPEDVKTHAKAAIGKREGKIDNLTRRQEIQAEEKRIKEDKKDRDEIKKQEKEEEEMKKKDEVRVVQDYVEELGIGEAEVMFAGRPKAVDPVEHVAAQALVAEAVKLTKATVTSGNIKEDKDLLVDTAPTLVDTAPTLSTEAAEGKDETPVKVQELSREDLAEVEEALETIGGKQRRLIIEEQELSELKEEMQDYQEDIADFKRVMEQCPERNDLKESKGAQRLFNKINRLIAQAEPVIEALNNKTKEMKELADAGKADDHHQDTLVNLEDLINHLQQVAATPDSTKLTVIKDVLSAMDTDNDGAIKLEHILHALELLSEDQVGVPAKVFEEVVLAMTKEEQLETKSVVQKAIGITKGEEPSSSSTATDGTNANAASGVVAAAKSAAPNTKTGGGSGKTEQEEGRQV